MKTVGNTNKDFDAIFFTFCRKYKPGFKLALVRTKDEFYGRCAVSRKGHPVLCKFAAIFISSLYTI
jgi:hypothetical protein